MRLALRDLQQGFREESCILKVFAVATRRHYIARLPKLKKNRSIPLTSNLLKCPDGLLSGIQMADSNFNALHIPGR